MYKFKVSLWAIAFLLGMNTHAEIVENVKITRIFVQSLNGFHKSDAHAIKVSKDIDESCGQRLHIDAEDKEIFSTVLAYKLSDSEFNMMYATGDPAKVITGHLMSSCKLLSIY